MPAPFPATVSFETQQVGQQESRRSSREPGGDLDAGSSGGAAFLGEREAVGERTGEEFLEAPVETQLAPAPQGVLRRRNLLADEPLILIVPGQEVEIFEAGLSHHPGRPAACALDHQVQPGESSVPDAAQAEAAVGVALLSQGQAVDTQRRGETVSKAVLEFKRGAVPLLLTLLQRGGGASLGRADSQAVVTLTAPDQTVANDVASYLLAPLPLRTVKDQSEKVDPKEEGNPGKSVTPLGVDRLEIEEGPVLVELDLPTGERRALQSDPVILLQGIDRKARHHEASTRTARREEWPLGGGDRAQFKLPRMQRSE